MVLCKKKKKVGVGEKEEEEKTFQKSYKKIE